VIGLKDVTVVDQTTDALDRRCTVLGPDGGSPVLLGALLPMTKPNDGGADPRGVYRANAIRLVLNQLNAPVREGIRGRPLTAIVCDTQSDPNQGADLAGTLVNQGAVAIVCAGSAETLSEAKVTIPAGVLLMSSSATSPEITDLQANAEDAAVRIVWRTTASDEFQGKVIAEVLSAGALDAGRGASDGGQDASVPLVGIIELDDPYGQGLTRAFQTNYPPSSSFAHLYEQNGDAGGAIADMASKAPDIVLAIAFPPDAVAIVNNAPRYGLNIPGPRWFFTDGAQSPDLLSGVPPVALQGARGTAPATADPTSAAFQWFSQEYRQTFNVDPTAQSFVANTFDAAMLLAIAAHWATGPGRSLNGISMAQALTMLSADAGQLVPLDPPDFNAAVSALDNGTPLTIAGASGPLHFDPKKGQAPATITIWQVDGGGFVTTATVQP
jgi:branched-chain amino acid transport system substrate-binding protein